jgi:AcrR family transcriptional regulator
MKNSKERILLVSFKLFLAKGFDKVSMNDLVKASGMSKGAFYHHFTGKEELFREAVKSHFFTGLPELKFTPLKDNTLSENLLNLVEFKAKGFKQLLDMTGLKELDSGYFTLIFQAIEFFPDFRKSLLFAGSSEEKMLEEIFDQAQKKGEISSICKSIDLAKIYASMLDGMELHAVVGGNMAELHKNEKEMTRKFIQLITSKD